MSANTREMLREQIFKNRKPRSVKMIFGGVEIEVRQPAYGLVLTGAGDETLSNAERAIILMTQMVYVPGSDELLFNRDDVQAFMDGPFDDDLQRLQEAINNLTVTQKDVDKAAK